ncbi:TPA: gliding motility-associated C-terminal domain-containing protein, partial [Neisseria gonorrhoeae]
IEASKVCRLLLSIANEYNTCLCSTETPISITTPTIIKQVANDLTLCETASAQLVAPVASNYLRYEWSVEGTTPATALSYLSNANVHLPTFKYTGTPLTAPKSFTYNVKVTRPDGCQATQKVTVTVDSAPVAPTATAKNYVGTKTVQDLINDIKAENSALSSATFKIYDGTGTELPSTTVLTSATYKVSATQTGQCESKKTDVVVTVTPAPSSLFGISPICATSQATIKTIKDAIQAANPTVTNIKVLVNGVEATDDTTILDATKTYKVTATKSGVTTDELTVSVTKQTATPTNNSVHFCEPISATVANLKTKLLGTRTGVTINVYGSDNVTTHPSAMADTETLTHQGLYSYTETKTGECESVRNNVTITISNLAKPSVTVSSGTCSLSGTTATITNYVSGLSYEITPNVGVTITGNTITGLVEGTNYTLKSKKDVCYSEVSDSFTANSKLPSSTAPTATAKKYCGVRTVQELIDDIKGENSLPSTTVYKLYDSSNVEVTTGNLVTGTYYITAQEGTKCESTKTGVSVTITAIPSSPSIVSQNYCSSANKTLGDLSSIVGLKWYDALVGGNVLLSTTKLQTGKYYASVVQDGCESGRTEVDVRITASPVKPEVELLSAANCTSVTRFKLKNEETGVTYELDNGVSVNIDATTKELKNLGVGKYKLIAKRGTCSSEASLEFEVFGQIVVGAPTVAPARTDCPTSSSSQFDMSSLVTASAGHTLKWYESATGSTPTIPQVERSVTSKTTYTKYVSQSNGTCESSRVAVIYVVDDTDTPTLNLPLNDLTIDCRSLTFDADVQTWLNRAVGNDGCAFTLTNNYVKPADLCTKGEIEVTFTVTDKFGKKVEGKKKIKLLHIDAVDDAEQTVSRTTGGNITVLSNDSYKGVTPVNVTDVTVTVVNQGTIPGTVLVNTDGTLKIPAGTPAGDYTIRYKICSKDHPTVCDEAEAKVKVTPNNIVAEDDDYTVNGVVKVSTSESIVKDTTKNTDKDILSNDTLGGTTGLSVGNVSITQVSTTNAGVTIDTATGKVKVSGNTPAGTYEIVYKIKENGTSNESNTAKVKVRVVNVLEANNDSFTGKTPTNSTPRVVGNILTNDKLNGNPPTPGNVTITEETPASPIPPGSKVPRLNTTTGDVEIPQGTPPGTYKITYKICNTLSDPNCVTAKITVNVTGNTIVAKDDDYRTELINGETGNADVGNILTNPNGQDTLDGAQATTSNVVISVVTPAGTGVVPTIEESTGKVSVPAHTAGGDYEITYKICEQDGSGNAINNCATAKVKLRVITLEAKDDDYSSTPTPQTNTEAREYEVLGNDKRNGQNPVPASNVKVTITNSAGIPGVTVDDTTGKVKIPSGTPPGVYELTYQICEKDHLGNASSICSSAKLKVKVEQSNTNTVLAKDDKVQVTRVNNRREKTFNVFADNGNGADTDPQGDTFTLTTHTDPAHGTLTQVAGQPSSFTYVPTSNFVGTDSFTYRICDNVAAPNQACSEATVTIEVRDIEANDDDFRTVVVNSAVGNTNIGNVLTNHTTGANKIDVLKNGSVGEVPATPTNVSVSVTNDDGLSTPLRIGSDGTVSLSDGNYASKEYTVEYQICEKGLASGVTNCDTAKVHLKVVRIKAQDNSYTGIDGINGNANVGNVLDNDEYDSSTTKPTLSTVTLREVRGAIALEAGKPVPVLDVTSGKVSVPANTPNGDYEIVYEICRKDYPNICSQAKIIVKVTGNIQAVDDQIRGVNGKRGGSLSNNRVPDANGNPYNVLSNDKLNGNPVSTSTVEITQGVEATPKELGKPSPKVTKTGFVEVPPNTPAGTYEVEYEICNLPGKTRCATAKVTIEVVSPKIEAKNDNFGRVLVKDNSITTSTVLTNDIYDGGQASLTDVLLSTDTSKPVPAGITLNAKNGTLTVAQGVPAGVYKYPYQICDKLDVTNCSQAVASVEVLDERVSILAVNDDLGILSQRGGTTSDNVLTNDYLNGKINPSYTTEVLLKPGTSPRTGLVMNSDGTITVIIGSNIPAGDYEYPYEICDRVNPTNCSSAKAKVTISSSPFNAINDRYEIKNEELSKGAQTTPSVLKNDELNGKIGLSLTEVSLTPGTSPHSEIVMNPDGTITIQPDVPIETYRYPYTICDKLNPTDCRTAVAIIVLEPSALEANPDDYTSRPIRGTGGQVGSILENDRLKNRPVNSNEVRITLENDGGLTGVTIDGEGQVHVPAHSPVGVYVLTYQICEASNLRNCRSTTIKVRVIDGRELKYYNGISVDGNGENDKFVIEGIESYPDNVLRIFNRWGVLVYEKRGYNNEDDAFVGISNGRVVISKDTKLPQGTYYYVLEYIDELGAKHRKASWLYIKREE